MSDRVRLTCAEPGEGDGFCLVAGSIRREVSCEAGPQDPDSFFSGRP